MFIVATANDVQILPAELLRKGRFDEIFYLTLPTVKERQAIFKVHLQRFRPDRVRDFNLDLLARQTNHFSGAEIEQVIFDAMHQAFAEGSPGQRRDFGDQDILRAAESTVPLAAIAHKRLEEMENWAQEMKVRSASQNTDLLQEFKKNIQQRQINPDHPFES